MFVENTFVYDSMNDKFLCYTGGILKKRYSGNIMKM
jgi:hypothetical protein